MVQEHGKRFDTRNINVRSELGAAVKLGMAHARSAILPEEDGLGLDACHDASWSKMQTQSDPKDGEKKAKAKASAKK